MDTKKEVIIVGAGLAGLICAIDLRLSGRTVTLIEKAEYPHHKVCGEFISNEVRTYLKALKIDLKEIKPVPITKFSMSTSSGTLLTSKLPLGGFGISRYALDNYLYKKAKSIGCAFIADTADRIEFLNNSFTIHTQNNETLTAELVIGAFGKRAALDQKLGRSFIKRKSPWLAVKGHYTGSIQSDTVFLHNFKGGYCGVSRVENGVINICYLTDYAQFKRYKNLEEFQEKVLSVNPQLKEIFDTCKPVFEKPLTISQISFAAKEPVYDHILMIGDTAGLIHPLCGNGMAMAIHSAKICADLCKQYLAGNIKTRLLLEQQYGNAWRANFKTRISTGRILSTILKKERLFNFLLDVMAKFPPLLSFIIKLTHGKPNI